MLPHMLNSFVNLCVIALAFVAAYGIVAMFFTPIQTIFLPEITAYASLMFLPHGVRILSTMYFGWKAVLPLTVGSWASGLIFTPDRVSYLPDFLVLASLFVGATCPFVSFEFFKLFGKNYYFTPRSQATHWKQLIVVGLLASVLNSLGQVVVHSDYIDPSAFIRVAATYAVGDTIGLIVMMLLLMLFFRWVRIAQKASQK